MPDVPPAFLVSARTTKREARFNIDRHLKEKGLPLTGSGLHIKRLYYPYWKIDAVLFKVRNRIDERVVSYDKNYNDDVVVENEKTDVSLTPYMTTLPAGTEMAGIPATIGLRADYLKMVPFSTENQQDEFDPLPLAKSWEEVRRTLNKRTNSLGNIVQADFGKNRTELFHPKASLVYFPYFVVESYPGKDYNRFVVDAVTGRVASHVTDRPQSDSFEYSEPVDYQPGQLLVIPHRCGNCGVDLPEEQSYIYICENCRQLAVLDNRADISAGVYTAETEASPNDLLFPFWSFGISQDQSSQLRPIFGGLFSSGRLVIPAFRVQNFDALCRLSKRISAAHPRLQLSLVEQFDARYKPVAVCSDEARMLADVFIHREKYQPGGAPAELITFRPTDTALFYAPFHPESYFYVDSILNAVTFERKLSV